MTSSPRPAKPAQPWHIPAIFGVTFLIHHLDRNVMSYALPHIADEFHWSDRQVGQWGQYLLSAFFITYGLGQMFLSGPAERWGPKRGLLAAICGFSLVSASFGIPGTTVAVLVGLRLLLGAAESVHVPMMSAIIARRFPAAIRATANSVWGAGIKLAAVLGPLLIVPLIVAVGWRGAFVVVGALSLAIAAPLIWFFIRVDDGPAIPPAARAHAPRGGNAFLRDPAFWTYTLVGLLNNITGFGVLGWLPTYLVRARHVAFGNLVQPLALIGFLGSLGMLLFAWLGDRFGVRLRAAAAGLILSGAAVGIARFADGTAALVAVFALASIGQSTYGAIEWSTAQLIARDRDVGAATGIYNGVGVLIGGVLGSMLPGAIVAATGDFDLALLAIGSAAVIGGVLLAGLRHFRPELD